MGSIKRTVHVADCACDEKGVDPDCIEASRANSGKLAGPDPTKDTIPGDGLYRNPRAKAAEPVKCETCGGMGAVRHCPEPTCENGFKPPQTEAAKWKCWVHGRDYGVCTPQCTYWRPPQDGPMSHERELETQLAAANARIQELERVLVDFETDAWPAGTRQELIQLRDEKGAAAQAVFAAVKAKEEVEEKLAFSREGLVAERKRAQALEQELADLRSQR